MTDRDKVKSPSPGGGNQSAERDAMRAGGKEGTDRDAKQVGGSPGGTRTGNQVAEKGSAVGRGGDGTGGHGSGGKHKASQGATAK